MLEEIDKMKNITNQIKAANENSMNLLLGEVNFDPKTNIK